jgi:hypothetical protein
MIAVIAGVVLGIFVVVVVRTEQMKGHSNIKHLSKQTSHIIQLNE